jgi:hypothetical protein
VIQAGDTLFSIAQRYGVSVDILASANCLENTALIYAGQNLRVPPNVTPNSPNPAQNPADAGVEFCDQASARITSPLPGAALEGFITLQGTAQGARYILAWRQDLPDAPLQVFEESYQSVAAGTLGRFDTDTLAPALYWFHLVVFDAQNNILGQCAIRVRFR